MKSYMTFAWMSHDAEDSGAPLSSSKQYQFGKRTLFMKSQNIRNIMNVSALALGLVGVAGSAWATVETTSPVYVGAATTIQGNGGSGAHYTYFSQRMVNPISYAGKISNVQGGNLVDTNASWVDSQFGTNGTQAYVEFDNGMMVDVATTSAGAQSLVLAGGLSGVASAGDAYRVRAHWTIASLFGTNNEAGLKGSFTPSKADNIQLQIPQTQQTMTIFYLNAGLTPGWYRADGTPAANQIVYPEEGIIVKRTDVSDVNLFTCGPVKVGTTVAPVETGYNLVGTLKSLTDVTLANLGLYTGNPATGLASGTRPGTADSLLVQQADGSSKTYFYLTSVGWFDNVGNPSDTVTMKAGSAFFIKRNGSPFSWTIPAE